MKKQAPSRFRQGFDHAFDRLRDRFFSPLLDRAVDYRYFTLGLIIMLLMFAVAIPAGGKLKFVGFPDIEGDVVEARILLPQGTPLANLHLTLLDKLGAAHRDGGGRNGAGIGARQRAVQAAPAGWTGPGA